jgi:upstream activation factor subunit UAF30
MPKGSGLTKPLKLSAALADIVGKKEASRAECIKQLWAYLKKHNLQDPENKQYFTPDKKMAKVFGTEKIRGFGMAKFLSDHLTPIDA